MTYEDMYSDLRGHSMSIATRRARLEAREAGFLVYIKFRLYFPIYYGQLLSSGVVDAVLDFEFSRHQFF